MTELITAAMAGKWTEEQAWSWYEKQPWIRGWCGYPANCVNRIEYHSQSAIEHSRCD